MLRAAAAIRRRVQGNAPRLFNNLQLSVSGTTLRQPASPPAGITFRGAISCCGGGYGWPQFNEAWVDYIAGYGANALHMRLGPTLVAAEAAGIGDGYVESAGKADLTQWNPVFWERVKALISYAGLKGMWVEVDIADGWGIKYSRAGNSYSAWRAANNVQNTDYTTNAGSVTISASSVYDLWVRKVVQETGQYGNVIYQDGNEIGLVAESSGPAYAVAWTTSMLAIVRNEETARGYVQHLFGTNSQNMTAVAACDYSAWHDSIVHAVMGGKPTMVNEYGSTLAPQDLMDDICAAKALGSYVWYWREGQSAGDMDATLALIQQGCP